MIKLVRKWIRGILWDEKVAAASLRSILTFFGATGSIIIASASDATGGVNADIIRQWDWKAWGIRIAAAAWLAAAVRIRAGDKNVPRPTPGTQP